MTEPRLSTGRNFFNHMVAILCDYKRKRKQKENLNTLEKTK